MKNHTSFSRISLAVIKAVFVAFLVAGSAHAQNPRIEVQVIEDGVTAKDVQSIKATITAASLKIGKVRQPKDVHVKLTKLFDNAFASKFTDLFMPTKLFSLRAAKLGREGQIRLNEKALFKHPKFMKPVVVHEYGHLVFLENASVRFKDFETFQFRVARAEFLDVQVNAIYRELEPFEAEAQDIQRALDAAKPGSVEEVQAQRRMQALNKKVAPIVARLEAKASERDAEMNTALKMWVIQEPIRALNEMFADVVAISALGDRSAVRDALLFAGGSSEEARSAKYRDFNGRVGVERWNVNARHSLYAPLRSFIGEHYFDHPDYRNNRGRLVELVWDAVEAELAAIRSNKTLLQSSPEALNRRMISRLTAIAGFPR